MRGAARRSTVTHSAGTDGIDASADMVRSGMAWAFTKYMTDPQIKVIEDEARGERRGLWFDREWVPPGERRSGRSGKR